ncbi:unnamed protein product [Adineta steineri]|uniref:Uncharacterized protein n=1 Tax=Adineta steineri TaxID=433720 RepID=A0A813QQ78_9BILA|nr:unnamed protein product [Adineta steineri]CAF3660377.1 unnamed protein product [Adineta steineri]
MIKLNNIIFLINLSFIFCIKTDINFNLYNVPSLLRCEKNGPLYYFNRFPSDEEFDKILKTRNIPCDLSLTRTYHRAIISIHKLDLLCEHFNKTQHANEFLFFSTKCSVDLCKRFLPSSTIIITEFEKGNVNIERIDVVIQINYSTQLIIGQLTNYYPSETEDPLDHNMIYRAVQEFQQANPTADRILLRKFDLNLDNSSLSLNQTNIDPSKTSTSILLIFICSMSICGIYYCCKNKSTNQLTNNTNRSSKESQDSQETLEDIYID